MQMDNRSKLVSMTIRNIGCVGDEGLTIALDNIVCIVGKNNAGKSTVLRAYELAKSPAKFVSSLDRYQLASNAQPSEILLEVHIPDGIGNVDNRWKEDKDGLRIVKSRWQWQYPDFKSERTTWNPEGGENSDGDWDNDSKAGGADSVFSSRLPEPLRIGSLDDSNKTDEILLKLALTPLIESIKEEGEKSDSDLSVKIAEVVKQIDKLSNEHSQHFNEIAKKITAGFQSVFPNMNVRLDIGTSPLVPKISDLIQNGSNIRIGDGRMDTVLSQQGTGSRRALFWAMLQVHNELTRNIEIRAAYRKNLVKDLGNEEKKLTKELKKNQNGTSEELSVIRTTLGDIQAKLNAHDAGAPIPHDENDPALPGYLLLIDEPENALHPIAARAAQRHLYKLAENPDWQVMMTTHSPYFINPFEDHTAIIRLERHISDEGGTISPRTYRSNLIEFVGDEKRKLQALQQIDSSFAEIFFGSYPILVEGDTEHASFIAAVIEKEHELLNQVTVIRARGKAILVPLIKVMEHFKIDFGIIHDSDSPYNKNGDRNGMWTENEKIHNAITNVRNAGITVRHRVSIPDFERFIGSEQGSKDKPLMAYCRISDDNDLAKDIQSLLKDLLSSNQHEPLGNNNSNYLDALYEQVSKWATDNNNTDVCFLGR